MKPLICTAISSKKIISFYYNGGFRTLEPFCYGVSPAGIEVLRAYPIRPVARHVMIPHAKCNMAM
ncbi:Uncharacterised protein [uncultured archaeon]|nr:Uncharacterised protein [uncultured archaeon]